MSEATEATEEEAPIEKVIPDRRIFRLFRPEDCTIESEDIPGKEAKLEVNAVSDEGPVTGDAGVEGEGWSIDVTWSTGEFSVAVEGELPEAFDCKIVFIL